MFPATQGHEGAVNAVAVSPFHEEVFATGGTDGRFYIWCLNKSGDENVSILYFYRFPPPDSTTDLGITWLQVTELEAPLPGATGSVSQGAEDEEDRQRFRGENAVRSQRITCCFALPAVSGMGFLVGTKAGVISLFKPDFEAEVGAQKYRFEVMAFQK